MISGAEKIEANCTRRSPDSAPLDAGSIPAISTEFPCETKARLRCSRAFVVPPARGAGRKRIAAAAAIQEVTGLGADPDALKLYRYVPDVLLGVQRHGDRARGPSSGERVAQGGTAGARILVVNLCAAHAMRHS